MGENATSCQSVIFHKPGEGKSEHKKRDPISAKKNFHLFVLRAGPIYG